MMNIRGAGWKALLVSAVLILLSLGSSFWLITAQQQRLYNEDLTRQLLTAARMVREALREGWVTYDVSRVAGLVHTLQSDGAAVVIIAADRECVGQHFRGFRARRRFAGTTGSSPGAADRLGRRDASSG